MNDQLISKQQLQKRYGVCRQTILTWMRKYDLPVIEISQHRKYFRMSDVLKWEEELMVQGKKPTRPVLD